MLRHLRKDFPILGLKEDGHDIVYLDSGATTQRPKQVIDRMVMFYEQENANISRGIYKLGEQATATYENARVKVANFIGAKPDEVVFVRNSTEGINFIATAWGSENLKSGDEIIVSQLEHHSNFIPWMMLAKKTGAKFRVAPIHDNGDLDMEAFADMLNKKTKMVAMTQSSNAIGTHIDVKRITEMAHAVVAKVLVDGAQSVPHQKVDVKEIGCDFLVFSGHKALGPTGASVLFIDEAVRDQVPPYQFGGAMVYEIKADSCVWRKAPECYEAGTPAIAQVVGLGTAVDYLKKNVDFDLLRKHEAELCARTIDGLSSIKGVRILGNEDELKSRGHLVTFCVDGMHAHDTAAYLGSKGICVRAGHHCAQPLLNRLGVESTIRASFYFYNTAEEVDFLVKSLDEFVAGFCQSIGGCRDMGSCLQ